MMNCNLDLTDDVTVNIVMNVNRDLNKRIRAMITEGEAFQFSGYTYALLEVRVRPNDQSKILTFSTDDNSIQLESDGYFRLIKSASEMNVKSGEYLMDMYLGEDKRAFMSGKIILQQTVSR